MNCRCRVEHETVACVDCKIDVTHYKYTAFDGSPRCGRCHVSVAEAYRKLNIRSMEVKHGQQESVF